MVVVIESNQTVGAREHGEVPTAQTRLVEGVYVNTNKRKPARKKKVAGRQLEYYSEGSWQGGRRRRRRREVWTRG